MRSEGKKLAQVARCQARGQLHIPQERGEREHQAEFDEAVAGFGLVIVDDDGQATEPPEEFIYLWPCNLPTFNLWLRVQTQWVVGMAGREGLNYASVIRFMERFGGIARKDQDEVFKGLQAMERAALAVWADQRGTD